MTKKLDRPWPALHHPHCRARFIDDIVRAALLEDLRPRRGCDQPGLPAFRMRKAEAVIRARQPGTMAGLPLAASCLSPRSATACRVSPPRLSDGARIGFRLAMSWPALQGPALAGAVGGARGAELPHASLWHRDGHTRSYRRRHRPHPRQGGVHPQDAAGPARGAEIRRAAKAAGRTTASGSTMRSSSRTTTLRSAAAWWRRCTRPRPLPAI
jgi:hypothetical protein